MILVLKQCYVRFVGHFMLRQICWALSKIFWKRTMTQKLAKYIRICLKRFFEKCLLVNPYVFWTFLKSTNSHERNIAWGLKSLFGSPSAFSQTKSHPCVKRGCLILGGRSPPQAENFAILGPLNTDFQWENEPPEAKIWSKSGPEVKEPPPSLRTKSTRRGGFFARITPDKKTRS